MNANADVYYSVRSMFKTLVKIFAGLLPAHMAAPLEKPDENNSNEKGKEKKRKAEKSGTSLKCVVLVFNSCLFVPTCRLEASDLWI